jgi:hypothetical protein
VRYRPCLIFRASSLLPHGEVLFWGKEEHLAANEFLTSTWQWDPKTGVFTEFVNPRTHLFCSGQNLLLNGSVLAAGGNITVDDDGSNHTDLFAPKLNTWLPGPDMNNGRWYPSVTALADRKVLVTGGTYFDDTGTKTENQIPQVYKDGTWRALTRTTGIYGYYPWAFLAPNGRVFIAGPSAGTRYLNTAGAGRLGPYLMNNFGDRRYGSAVLYDTGRILILGGPNTNSAEVINLMVAKPRWRYFSSMSYARKYATGTLLPDGKVFVSGGTSNTINDNSTAVLPTEMWDPATEQWTTWASISKPRIYHSTALLLPDARVLVAGGGNPPPLNGGVNNFDAEIFSPPYLFRGPRPEIRSVASLLHRLEPVTLASRQARQIGKISLLRLGSVTHNFDMNQRIHFPAFQRSQNQLQFTLPTSRNVLPPGYYMLFIINREGVPSEAKIVKVM